MGRGDVALFNTCLIVGKLRYLRYETIGREKLRLRSKEGKGNIEAVTIVGRTAVSYWVIPELFNEAFPDTYEVKKQG
mgnify:CR=1 FL=1